MSKVVNTKTGSQDIMESKDDIKVSVICVCYNPDFDKLKKTINSCIRQKNVNFEIIVSDDGSKENYESKLMEWAKENEIELVYNFLKKNVGTVKNIISATKLAKGKYIKTISPGDYFSREDSLKQFLDMYENFDYDLVYSNGIFYNNRKLLNNIKMPYFSSTYGKDIKFNIATFSDCFLGASLSFKKENIKFLEDISDYVRLTEDLPLIYLALLNKKNIGFIKERLVWYEYGVGVSSISHNLDKDISGFMQFLKENYINEKMVKLTLKTRNNDEKKCKLLKIINYFFISPKLFFTRIIKKIKRREKISEKIEDQDKITEDIKSGNKLNKI